MALLASGLWFSVLKATPISNAYTVALLQVVTGRFHLSVVADPGDLIALAMLPLAWARWRVIAGRCGDPGWRQSRGLKRGLGLAVLIAASLAAIATSPNHPVLNYGLVFDVAADAGDANTWYASLATRRIECEKAQRSTPVLSGSCEVATANDTVEIHRSQDGGRTWTPYTSVGGYLWSDPHISARLYVLNEDGLHRIESGLDRLLDVPFQQSGIKLFQDDEFYEVGLLPNVHSLAFDPVTPDVLYLADGDRILVSLDAGGSWHLLAQVRLAASVTALAVAPSAPQTLYATDGNAISRSDDGGHTWSPAISPDKEARIRALAVHPAAPETVYAAGNGVWLSTSGCSGWRCIGDAWAAQSIVVSPVDPNLIIVVRPRQLSSDGSTSDLGGGYAVFSDDGGKIWHRDDDLTGWEVVISPLTPHRAMLALGERGIAVLESAHGTDLGEGWQVLKEGLPVFVELR
ncbi:MAG: hypothetical protein JXA89_28755 [Anaerolineae bacterium]|nr:hypothetical protein [Anaerolineae bacterium]